MISDIRSGRPPALTVLRTSWSAQKRAALLVMCAAVHELPASAVWPSVRRIVESCGYSLDQLALTPTGPKGRLVKADVLVAVQRESRASSSASAPPLCTGVGALYLRARMCVSVHARARVSVCVCVCGCCGCLAVELPHVSFLARM